MRVQTVMIQASINPSASEIPADGVDQNCDAYEDCFEDSDLDGFGSTGISASASLFVPVLPLQTMTMIVMMVQLKHFRERQKMILPLHVWRTMMGMAMVI